MATDFNRLIQRDLTLAGEIVDLTNAKLELEMSFLTGTPTEKETARVAKLGEQIAALQKIGNFYTPERFAGVELSDHLKRFVAQSPWTWNRIRMNRMLLEAAYPQAIAKSLGGVYPDIEMYIYPRPTRDLEWHFISVEELTQPATLATQLHFPPGYLRAFRYNLATEMSPEFGMEPSAQVMRIAMTSKRNLKRINNPDDIMSMPYSLVATRQRYNIFAGNY
jgi:hypothetical protein